MPGLQYKFVAPSAGTAYSRVPNAVTSSSVQEKWFPTAQSVLKVAPTSRDRYFHGRIASGWQLKRPLWVVVERDEDGSYLVSDEQFMMYGVGDSEESAVRDYFVSLIDLYGFMRERASESPEDSRQFHQLQSYLRPATYARQNDL